jgi:hypothetical protein
MGWCNKTCTAQMCTRIDVAVKLYFIQNVFPLVEQTCVLSVPGLSFFFINEVYVNNKKIKLHVASPKT